MHAGGGDHSFLIGLGVHEVIGWSLPLIDCFESKASDLFNIVADIPDFVHLQQIDLSIEVLRQITIGSILHKTVEATVVPNV